jgi:hypothetical protein
MRREGAEISKWDGAAQHSFTPTLYPIRTQRRYQDCRYVPSPAPLRHLLAKLGTADTHRGTAPLVGCQTLCLSCHTSECAKRRVTSTSPVSRQSTPQTRASSFRGSKRDGTSNPECHRVWCRHHDTPRLRQPQTDLYRPVHCARGVFHCIPASQDRGRDAARSLTGQLPPPPDRGALCTATRISRRG